MVRNYKKSLYLGLAVGALHLLFCVFLFVMVQLSDEGQAGFAWFFMFELDYPTAQFFFNLFEDSQIMQVIIDWWWSFAGNQGTNIRALLIFGIFGTLQWFLVSSALGLLLQKLWAVVTSKKAVF